MYAKLSLAVALTFLHGSISAATLSEITEQALARSPDVRAKLHEFLASGYEQDAARGGLYPRLDLEAYAGRERQVIADKSNTFNHPGISLQLRQLLFDGFATRNEARRLGHIKTQRYYELLGTADEIALETARAYTDVQRYRTLSSLAQENWVTHKEIFDQIDQRVRAGVGRRVDGEQASGRLALAQSNWLTETSNLHDVSARFERIVGDNPPLLGETPNVTKQLPGEREYLGDTIANSPSFQAAVANLRSARSLTSVRRAAYSPTIEARGIHNIERNHGGTPGKYQDSIAQVVLNYNLFRGGSDQARIRAAEEGYNAALAQRDKTCRDLRQTATIAWNDARKLREQLRYLEQHALATERARDAYRQQFEIGQRSLLDVLDTENELFEARRALTRAQYDLKFAELRVLSVGHRLLSSLGLAARNETIDLQGNEKDEDNAALCDTVLPRYETLDTAAAFAQRPPRTIAAPIPPSLITPPSSSNQQPPLTAPVPVQCTFAANDWAAAWSAKDLNKYLGYYSSEFQPLTSADRDGWRKLRASRLNKPNIAVTLDKPEVRQLSNTSCEINFNQQYRSSDYNDDVKKTLVLQLEGASWKIVRELVPRRGSSN